MKWLFVLLSLANAAFWMWTHWYSPAVDLELYQPKPAVNAQQLRLLSETGVPVPARPATESAASPASACYRLGPFPAQKAARAAGDKLQARARVALTYTLSEERRDQPMVYRIVLPGFASQKAAQAKLKEINRLGIKDSALITTPEKRPAISLGVFSQKAGAERYLGELAQKGIQAQMEAMPRAQIGAQVSYWLDLAPLPRSSAQQLHALVVDGGEVHLRERPCLPSSARAQSP